jgi:Tfp pilus assembly protein PilO
MRKFTLRFTIVDLLWLALAVALAIGWWLDHSGIQKQRDRLRAQQAELELKSEDLDKRRESVKHLLDNLQEQPAHKIIGQ